MPRRRPGQSQEGLTPMRLAFVEAYHKSRGNETKAAKAAGYRCPRSMGSRLMKVGAIRRAIRKRSVEVSEAAKVEREEGVEGMREVREIWAKVTRAARCRGEEARPV